MKEKQMQTIFTNYIRKNPPTESEVYELKITSKRLLSFKAVKAHQIDALLSSESYGIFHKITDQPWIKDRPNAFTSKKPFDCFFIRNTKSYVVIWFYIPRKPKVFYKIRITDFLKMEEETTRKSFTEEMVKNYGKALIIKY